MRQLTLPLEFEPPPPRKPTQFFVRQGFMKGQWVVYRINVWGGHDVQADGYSETLARELCRKMNDDDAAKPTP